MRGNGRTTTARSIIVACIEPLVRYQQMVELDIRCACIYTHEVEREKPTRRAECQG